MNSVTSINSKKPLLQVKGLHVSYGLVEALSGIDLTLKQGQLVTVIGPNGAGKTTLLSSIMGLLPSDGEILFDGIMYHHPQVETLVASGLGLVPEKRELFASMSVLDNLQLGAFQRHRKGDKTYKETLNEVFTLFPRLKERSQQQA